MIVWPAMLYNHNVTHIKVRLLPDTLWWTKMLNVIWVRVNYTVRSRAIGTRNEIITFAAAFHFSDWWEVKRANIRRPVGTCHSRHSLFFCAHGSAFISSILPVSCIVYMEIYLIRYFQRNISTTPERFPTSAATKNRSFSQSVNLALYNFIIFYFLIPQFLQYFQTDRPVYIKASLYHFFFLMTRNF